MSKRRFAYSFWLTAALILFQMCLMALVFGGCGYYDEHEARTQRIGSGTSPVAALPCRAATVRPPVSDGDMMNVYAGRSFYADGNHLGHDVMLPEGAAIRAITCGRLVVYRPANGYGALAAVIEHEFPFPVELTNGVGETVPVTRFLSIYGHLRTTANRTGSKGATGLAPGDRVNGAQTVGYVDQDATNGDGAEHLHLGIRLQSAADAAADDPDAWFRGYDAAQSRRRWFADPALFLSQAHAALGGHACGDGGSAGDAPGGGGGSPTGVPPGTVHFVYTGSGVSGIHELHGAWDVPGPGSVSWGQEATVQCPDIVSQDNGLECVLAMPSGTKNVLFTVRLPDGRWWGDMSSDPTGGHGKTIGTVELTGPNGAIPYKMVNNGTGPDYYNGFVSVIP